MIDDRVLRVLIIFLDDGQGLGGTFPGTSAAGDTFEGYPLTFVQFHIVGGAGFDTSVAFVAQLLAQHHDAQLVDLQRFGRTGIHAGGALVAYAQPEIIIAFIDYIDTGFFGIVFFEIELRTRRYTGVTADTFIVVSF
jgi:hypothetical protein